MALGPHALGLFGQTQVHEVLQELGAIVLLFMVGLDRAARERRERAARTEEIEGIGG